MTASAAAAPAAVRPLSFLAFDYGLRRIGVATGNTLTRSASPLRTIAAPGDAAFAAIAALVAEWRPDALVVGIPRHPDGAAHENTARAERFARRLEGRCRLPVHRVDERYTTVEALARRREGGGRGEVDAQAAAIILDQYFTEAAA